MRAPGSATATMILGLVWRVTRELLAGARSDSRSTSGLPQSLAGGGSPPDGHEPSFDRSHTPPVVHRETSIAAIAARLSAQSAVQTGYRTMIAPENDSLDCAAEAMALAKALGAAGRQTLLIDWSAVGPGFAQRIGMPDKPGLNNLLAGDASFEDIVKRLPGCEAHFIACGKPQADPALDSDADRLNLVLDALDEAYEHIIVLSDHEGARHLFQTIQGRFDAGITVGDPMKRQDMAEDPPSSFLHFEVNDLEIIRYERSARAPISFKRLGSGHAVDRVPRQVVSQASH